MRPLRDVSCWLSGPRRLAARAALSASLLGGVSRAAPGDTPPSIPTETPADAAADRATTPSADALIEESIRRRRAGDDEGAREVLERARTLAPDSSRVQVHLASVYQALGNWVAAKGLLVQVLGRSGDGYVERNRGLLRDALEAVLRHVGEISVVGGPAGATVRLDGRAVGELPLAAGIEAPVGVHVIAVEARGYWPMARSIELHARERRRESVELERRPDPAGREESGHGASDASASDGAAAGDVLTWSLAGAASVAAVAGAVAWGARETHASRWNSDDCLRFGSTRERQCGREREAARRYETLAIAGGVTALLLGGGAALSAWLTPDADDDVTGVSLGGCALAVTGVECHGRF